MRQYAAQSAQLFENRWRVLIWNSHQQGRALSVHLLFRANGVDAGARRIGDCVVVDDVTLTVEECVKGHIVQRDLRNEQQMLRSQTITQLPEKFVIQALNVYDVRVYVLVA